VSGRATLAIIDARVRAERRTLVYACASAAVVGFVAPLGMAGPVFFCSLLGIVIALVQTPGRFPHLDLCEQGAPLYGRQLARAKALVPCVVATLATLVYVTAAEVVGSREMPATLLVALAAVIPSTLTALSATIRVGSSRMLYVALACTASAIAFTLAAVAHSIAGELGFAVFASFLALRQYGEALARYDPVGD
jgi:hypothetical protein